MIRLLTILLFTFSSASFNYESELENEPGNEWHSPIKHCLDLTSQSWSSPHVLRFKFEFADGGTSFLARTRTPKSFRINDVTYTSALAKIVHPLDDQVMDKQDYHDAMIQINTDKRMNWYLGIDGNPNERQFDFVSICRHELLHAFLHTEFDHLKVKKIFGRSIAKFRAITRWQTFLVFETNHGTDCALSSISNRPRMLHKLITSGDVYFSNSTHRIVKVVTPNQYSPNSLTHTELNENDPQDNILFTSLRKGMVRHDYDPNLSQIVSTISNPNEIGAPLCYKDAVPRGMKDIFRGLVNRFRESRDEL